MIAAVAQGQASHKYQHVQQDNGIGKCFSSLLWPVFTTTLITYVGPNVNMFNRSLEFILPPGRWWSQRYVWRSNHRCLKFYREFSFTFFSVSNNSSANGLTYFRPKTPPPSGRAVIYNTISGISSIVECRVASGVPINSISTASVCRCKLAGFARPTTVNHRTGTTRNRNIIIALNCIIMDWWDQYWPDFGTGRSNV